MANFKEEHNEILEKHKHLYDCLMEAGFMRNTDPNDFNELQQVFNEAISPERFTHWCAACVYDMVNRLYKNWEEWKNAQETEVTEPNKRRKRNG